jgi:hypothetical protein
MTIQKDRYNYNFMQSIVISSSLDSRRYSILLIGNVKRDRNVKKWLKAEMRTINSRTDTSQKTSVGLMSTTEVPRYSLNCGGPSVSIMQVTADT